MSGSSSRFADTGVHPADAAAFDALVAAGVRGNLVIVVSPAGDPAPGVSARAAQLLLSDPQARQLDIHLAVPAADRWTVDEIDDLIIRPAQMKAFERTHVVVADADAMTSAAVDHLLKTVEEPTSDAVFWFCVRDTAALKATLRGRAAAELPARPAPVADRIAALVADGADPQLAAQVATLAGADMQLARAVLADPSLLEPLRTLSSTPPTSATPTATAQTLLDAVITLAVATAAVSTDPAPAKPKRTRRSAETTRKRTGWSALTAQQKPAGRRLLRKVLDRWRAELPQRVATAETAAEFAAATRLATALEAALKELSTHASPLTVLAALLVRADG